VDSSPVLARDTLVFGSMDGKLYLLSAKTGKEITSYEIGESISSTPAITKGKIIVGCEDGKVYAFQVESKR
jgi:outer membrane protein assembly factor BamB